MPDDLTKNNDKSGSSPLLTSVSSYLFSSKSMHYWPPQLRQFDLNGLPLFGVRLAQGLGRDCFADKPSQQNHGQQIGQRLYRLHRHFA